MVKGIRTYREQYSWNEPWVLISRSLPHIYYKLWLKVYIIYKRVRISCLTWANARQNEQNEKKIIIIIPSDMFPTVNYTVSRRLSLSSLIFFFLFLFHYKSRRIKIRTSARDSRFLLCKSYIDKQLTANILYDRNRFLFSPTNFRIHKYNFYPNVFERSIVPLPNECGRSSYAKVFLFIRTF